MVALSGDYDFQFMIEELAVAARHRIPYVHVLVNNSYLGLIRRAQRAFDIDFQVSPEFENINGLGCKAIRVTDPGELGAALEQAKKLPGHAPTSIRPLRVVWALNGTRRPRAGGPRFASPVSPASPVRDLNVPVSGGG